MSEAEPRYWAFISYSHRDKAWGDWLHKALETYRVPKHLVGSDSRNGPVPARAFPVFRDREELPGSSDLGANINEALVGSRYLIVICSPRAAASLWVNEEIKHFKALGREDRVLCLIVDGEPNATDRPELGELECFPEAVRFRVSTDGVLLDARTEPIAADARPGKDGKANARLKLLAGILGVNYDDLKQRDQARRLRRMQVITGASLALVATLGALSIGFYQARNAAEAARASEAVARGVAEQERVTALKRLADSYRERGFEAYLSGDHERALLYFHEVRTIAPDESSVRHALADSWARLRPLTASISGDEQPATRLRFSSDGGALLIQNGVGQVRRVNLDSHAVQFATTPFIGNMAAPLLGTSARRGGTERVAGLHSAPDPNNPDRLVRSIRVLDESGVVQAALPWPGDRAMPDEIAMSADGSTMVIVDDANDDAPRVRLWRIGADTEPAAFAMDEPAGNYRFHLSPDGRFLVLERYTGASGFRLLLKDGTSGAELARAELPTRAERVAFIMQTTPQRPEPLLLLGLADGTMQARALTADLPTVWSRPGEHIDGVDIIDTSADGERVLSADALGAMAIRNATTGEPLWQRRERIEGVVHAAAFAPDDAKIGVAHGQRVSVLEPGRGDKPDTLAFEASWSGAPPQSLAFDSEGQRVAVATENGTARVWSTGTRGAQRLRRFALPAGEHGFARIESPAPGRYLAFGANVYAFEQSSETLSKIADNGAMGLALAMQHKVWARSGFGFVQVVKVSADGKSVEHEETLQPAGQPLVIAAPEASEATLLAALPGGGVILFDRDGLPMTTQIPGNGAAGEPRSALFSPGGNAAAVSFNDGSVARFRIDETGIVEIETGRVQGVQGSVDLLDWQAETIMLRGANGLHLLTLGSDTTRRIPRQQVAGARLYLAEDGVALLTISPQGRVERWTEDLTLAAQAESSKVGVKRPTLSASQDIAGAGIAVQLGNSGELAATSLNDRIYLWRLPDLRLLWRSDAIGGAGLGQSAPLLIGFGADTNRLTFADSGTLPGQVTGLGVITPPTALPTPAEAERYLSAVARLALIDGRATVRALPSR